MGPDENRSGIRVMVVDDDDAFLRAARRLLEALGHDVFVAQSVSEAIAIQEEHDPDVALVDWALQQETGEQVCAALREFQPPPGIIVVTGLDVDELVERSLHAGAVYYMGKPLQRDRMKVFIQRLYKLRVESSVPPPPINGQGEPPCWVGRDGIVQFADGGRASRLSASQRRCLEYLLRRRDSVVSAEEIRQRLGLSSPHAAENLIFKIRERLGPRRGCIETVRGEGFIIRSLSRH
ncbi:MAG: response regulator [Polyangiaceae bacterium]